MSRSLYYSPWIQPEEDSTKDIQIMDALKVYFNSEGPWVLDYSHLNLLRALVIATGMGEYLIDVIEKHGAVHVEIRY